MNTSIYVFHKQADENQNSYLNINVEGLEFY